MRLVKWLPVVIVGLIVLAGSSLWAHQVIAERLAHSSYSTAETAVTADIARARSDGFFPSELEAYSARQAAIEEATPPSDKTFWSGSTESFYNRQGKSLRLLDHKLRAQLHALTLAAGAHVRWMLWTFGQRLRLGYKLGLGLVSQQQVLTNARFNLAQASTLGGYRELAGSLQTQLPALLQLVQDRQVNLRAVISSARRSAHPVLAVRSSIEADLAAGNADLALMRTFVQPRHLQRWLDHTVAWALSRPWLRYAAQGEADVETVLASIRARMQKVLPAKWIFVSTEGEYMNWYQHGTQVGTTPVTTGNPALPTVTGHFTIFAKFSPFTFISPLPPGAPDYYPPSPVSYAMEFQSAGYFIHDAPWRSVYGPGTDGPGTPGTNYGGSHGCVNTPFAAAQFLYGWTPIGTPVVVA